MNSGCSRIPLSEEENIKYKIIVMIITKAI